ncbi:nucleotidyltransferase family protein [Neobacillus mesonae]|uniref:nucleotidyltransferase family protein n=1 Tax=Neobacillus mesonae TaxID=1193713 RepID=UPI0033056550
MVASKKFLQEEYGIKKIGIFGTYARNEQQNTSDVDILIESDKALSLELLSIKFI